MQHYDVVVIGAGIVGLATAYRVLERHAGVRLAVLDKEPSVARHQSGHNSGVLHAGVYYPPGSLKARLCTAGKRDLEAFADQHGIPVEHNGKLIVALTEAELPGLDDLERRARTNGVEGLRAVGPEELREIEPHAAGLRALYSPRTGVIDFVAVAQAMADEIVNRGSELLLGREVVDLDETATGVRIATTGGDVTAGTVVACAGLQSDRVAALTDDAGDERIVPFRGSYLVLRPPARHVVRGHIYPVPDPRYPFLGVHLSRRIDGEVWVGPNAVLAGARETYRRWAWSWRDLRDIARFEGTWRLAQENLRAGVREVSQDVLRRRYIREVQRYVPELRPEDFEEGPVGIRAQAVRADGSMVDDFSLAESRRLVHVRNAPSPAATASLAIGAELAGRVDERLGAAA